MKTNTLTPDLLQKMDAYWRAANYLSAAQIYLCDNPLLKRPLTLADVKHMLLENWGTTPGQNFIQAIPIFEELTKVNPDSLVAAASYDRKMFGLLSYDSLAYCHFKSGRFLESAHYYTLAEKAAPELPEYRIKRLLAAARASGRP